MISVLLDSSVIIAGIVSKTGASRVLLTLSQKRKITVYTTALIMTEVVRNLKSKFPEKVTTQFLQYLAKSNFEKVEFLSESEIQLYKGITVKKDIHVIAAAYKAETNYLVSLDKKHVLSIPAKRLPFSIVTPREFLKVFRK